jgi:hypothetical protein
VKKGGSRKGKRSTGPSPDLDLELGLAIRSSFLQARRKFGEEGAWRALARGFTASALRFAEGAVRAERVRVGAVFTDALEVSLTAPVDVVGAHQAAVAVALREKRRKSCPSR